MKKVALLILSVFILSGCSSQTIGTSNECPQNIAFIDNDTVDYAIALIACDTCVPITNIGYRVILKMSENKMELLNNIDYTCWIKLLESEKTDWATNLILYSIKNKDALVLSRNNEEDWRKLMKNDDIEYWKTILKR